jgi:hypothetical protein
MGFSPRNIVWKVRTMQALGRIRRQNVYHSREWRLGEGNKRANVAFLSENLTG